MPDANIRNTVHRIFSVLIKEYSKRYSLFQVLREMIYKGNDIRKDFRKIRSTKGLKHLC